MKCQILFSRKIKKNISLLSTEFARSMVSVKDMLCHKNFFLYSIITKICVYNFDPLKPHFCIVKLGFTGVCIIFLILLTKHRLWVFIRTTSVRQF